MITEEYVLKNCMHNSDEILESVFFPKLLNELCKISVPVNSGGYNCAIRHIEPMTFEEWKRVRYKEFRKARYMPIPEQIDMMYHDSRDGTETLLEHIEFVKRKYPKP